MALLPAHNELTAASGCVHSAIKQKQHDQATGIWICSLSADRRQKPPCPCLLPVQDPLLPAVRHPNWSSGEGIFRGLWAAYFTHQTTRYHPPNAQTQTQRGSRKQKCFPTFRSSSPPSWSPKAAPPPPPCTPHPQAASGCVIGAPCHYSTPSTSTLNRAFHPHIRPPHPCFRVLA
jgi:hypothetical protein